jgi:hypothetical protein
MAQKCLLHAVPYTPRPGTIFLEIIQRKELTLVFLIFYTMFFGCFCYEALAVHHQASIITRLLPDNLRDWVGLFAGGYYMLFFVAIDSFPPEYLQRKNWEFWWALLTVLFSIGVIISANTLMGSYLGFLIFVPSLSFLLSQWD